MPWSMTYGQALNDLDSDGVVDRLDLDQDNDGILNEFEGLSRLGTLSDSPAHYYAVDPDFGVTHSESKVYGLVSAEDGHAATLSGRVLSTDTEFEWSMHGVLPRLRNLSSGSSTVQWSIASEQQVANIDLTISDLDGQRSESVAVSAASVVGYSLSLNSHIVVNAVNGQLLFTGTGPGGDSLDDLVTLHFRGSSAMVVTYSNHHSTDANSEAGSVTVAGGSEWGGVLNAEVGIAGFRHSLGYISSTYFTPVTRSRDTDADGIADHRDLDSDNDGLGDVFESAGIDIDNDNLIDGAVDEQGVSILANRSLTEASMSAVYNADGEVDGDDADRDGLLLSVDGMPDQFGGARYGIDSDNDGLDDLDEIRLYHTDPYVADTDGDGLSDHDELGLYNTSPLQNDTDRDGLNDGDEVNSHATSPISVDSDADGITDFEEIEAGSDPRVSNRTMVVSPNPIVEPDKGQEAAALTGFAEPMPLQPIEPEFVEEIFADNTEPESLLSDDATTGDTVALHTGLNGAAGCTIVAPGRSLDPGLPLLLILAFAGLTGKRRCRNCHA